MACARRLILLLICVFSTTIFANTTVHFLFIGDSYTYFQQTDQNPGLPHVFKQVVESIDPDLKVDYSAYTRGMYSFEDHYKDPKSHALMEGKYDHVVLQGQSMESLEMTPWMLQQGRAGVESFAVYLPKVLDLVLKNNNDITLFVNWIWNAKNELLSPSCPGLNFPQDSPRAGQSWCGKDRHEYQQMINQSYESHIKGYKNVKLSFVGSGWLALEDSGVVSRDELYKAGDWSHPSPLGTLTTALILARDILHLDPSKNTFLPPDVDAGQAGRVAHKLKP